MLLNKDLRNLCGAMPTAVRKLELLFLVFINIISIVHGEIAVVKGKFFYFFYFIIDFHWLPCRPLFLAVHFINIRI